ncbi:phenylalanine--tRNA ligase subunit alpha [Aureliella helgolandensis]|uniref:Phenylalanine--tRNA ligase alpha subunit n=1 Tax=Aureliella helgolandensis TaxID=2527968 RepID=A0A518GAR6_9BACT|nr:phenylalanine--tRNA ligase subunit alpha [Aureliella helgolandensis]QDV25630.1 Phenylalanine--tRNA ligase alpha subunit [Aureliella helgolandensis]
MELDEFLTTLETLAKQAEQAFTDAVEQELFEAARVQFMGARSGQMKTLQKLMGGLSKEDRPAGGKKLNEVKNRIQAAMESASQRLDVAGTGGSKSGPMIDATLPGERRHLGRVHPITQTIEHLKDIMGRLGFEVVEGPEVEDTWHNFVALNIPEDHPARDPLDNFYLSVAGQTSVDANAHAARLLRSQTSTVQIRVMENRQPPIRIISLGRVYRPDEADATHFPMFHQMEGLWIDTHVTMAQLKSVLRMFATSYLGADVTIRFRPSFFPFTEPSVEADFLWNGNWIEFGGAGMVDPNVLKSVGYDPEQVSGFAFGLGVERLCMRRHHVEDIRDLYRNDLRFLHQF